MLLQLIIFAASGMAVWFGSQWVNQEVDRVDSQMERLHKALAMAQVSRIPRLELNPATGVYRPIRLQHASARLLG
jgi:hypothetical protein